MWLLGGVMTLASVTSPELVAHWSERRAAIDRVLSLLPTEESEAVRVHYGMSVGRAGSRLALVRAIRKLRHPSRSKELLPFW